MGETGFRVECLEIRERQTVHITPVLTGAIPFIFGSSCTKQHEFVFQQQQGALGAGVVSLLSSRESCRTGSPQGSRARWGWAGCSRDAALHSTVLHRSNTRSGWLLPTSPSIYNNKENQSGIIPEPKQTCRFFFSFIRHFANKSTQKERYSS